MPHMREIHPLPRERREARIVANVMARSFAADELFSCFT
jgi:hypothetical protein